MRHFVHKVNAKYLAEYSFPQRGQSLSVLYDDHGSRKYLTARERNAFLLASHKLPHAGHTFCLLLAYTGCRISEGLAVTSRRFDVGTSAVIFETIKRRRTGVFRSVPIPQHVLETIASTRWIAHATSASEKGDARLWPWSRTTAWKMVKRAMSAADIDEPRATPKALRHSFAVASLQAGVPINLVKKWLGHARLSTTEIYADAQGEEERAIAERLWKDFE